MTKEREFPFVGNSGVFRCFVEGHFKTPWHLKKKFLSQSSGLLHICSHWSETPFNVFMKVPRLGNQRLSLAGQTFRQYCLIPSDSVLSPTLTWPQSFGTSRLCLMMKAMTRRSSSRLSVLRKRILLGPHCRGFTCVVNISKMMMIISK